MSETPDLPALDPRLDFQSAPSEAGTLTPFKVDDEMFMARRPKGGQLLAMTRGVTNMDALDDLGQAHLIDDFLDICMEADTADRLRERMEDPEDNFDVDDLAAIVQALQAVWGKGRPGRSGTSSRQPRRTGRSSTGRARKRA